MLSTNEETNVILEHDTIMFMDDNTLYEVLDVSPPYFWHATGRFWQ
jgi:predicted transcriptional regulator